MDHLELRKYYRSSGFDLNALMYKFLVTDNELRAYFRLGPYCGIIAFFVCTVTAIVILCSVISSNVTSRNEKIFEDLQDEANEKLPRRESVLSVVPAYNCIRRHLKQTDVFQEKMRKMLRKERLEIEITNSRISCINKLLKPEEQSRWRGSRSPEMFRRDADPPPSLE